MSVERLFLDTVFIQALLNRGDQYHSRALKLQPRVWNASRIVSTEAVMIEVGDALSRLDRPQAVAFIDQFLTDSSDPSSNVEIIPVDTNLLRRGLRLYSSHGDKQWGLTDCLSFVVMRDMGLVDALTADRHFVQAGFRAVMLEAG
jgi:predicted nucleic acid-binding protein